MVDRHEDITRAQDERWLTRYYFVRTAFSAVWVVLAFSVGQHFPASAVALLVVYPAWDALANYIDASHSGGLAENPTQAINVIISAITTVAVIVALRSDWVLGIFGVWAILSGLLQLATAVRRWSRLGAQWAMVLSGGQSAIGRGIFSGAKPRANPSRNWQSGRLRSGRRRLLSRLFGVAIGRPAAPQGCSNDLKHRRN
jgi:uncharacterized membrane protein HdeD (DUF308 family)